MGVLILLLYNFVFIIKTETGAVSASVTKTSNIIFIQRIERFTFILVGHVVINIICTMFALVHIRSPLKQKKKHIQMDMLLWWSLGDSNP